MYIHLGGESAAPEKEIIGVFDLDNTSISKITREFLTRAQQDGSVHNVSEDLPKSFVITARGKEKKVYISSVSSATIKARCEK